MECEFAGSKNPPNYYTSHSTFPYTLEPPRPPPHIRRPSARQYKATKKSSGEIAAELPVDCVVEGSVRCDGLRVRITGQLIEARDQSNLCSATYDRDLHDVLDVQTEVARQIGKALALELLPG